MNIEQERADFEAWLRIKPCGAAHDFAWEAWKARADLQSQPQETIAYVTRNEEGDPAMLFFDRNEARLYCEPGEEPEALVLAGSAPQAAVSVEHATLNLQPSSSMQPVATAFFTEQGEVAYTGIYDRTLKALEAVKTTRMGISCGSIDLYAHPQPAEPVKVPSDVQADAQIAQLLEEIERLERFAEALTERVRELEALLAAIGAGGVEPLRKTSADTSALRAALEEAEAALEVATSRLSARDANYPVHVTSEARALEIVRKALGKSQPDHFRDATKMMPADGASIVPEGRKLAPAVKESLTPAATVNQ